MDSLHRFSLLDLRETYHPRFLLGKWKHDAAPALPRIFSQPASSSVQFSQGEWRTPRAAIAETLQCAHERLPLETSLTAVSTECEHRRWALKSDLHSISGATRSHVTPSKVVNLSKFPFTWGQEWEQQKRSVVRAARVEVWTWLKWSQKSV